MQLSAMKLGRVMIHDVPRGDGSAIPTLTDAPVVLDDELRDYFRRKLQASLETRGIDVVADPDGEPAVRNAVSAILKDPKSLAARSKEIALRLAKAQSAINPEGLLTVLEIDLDSERAVAVMKLEREQGIRFEIKEVDGSATVDLELLRQLTLTNKTKVFKTALFTTKAPGDPMKVIGRASDNQRGLVEGRGVADFYLGTFLGFALADNPARTTQQFVAAVADFVNNSDLTDEKKGRYSLALVSELQSNTMDVSPRQFVSKHIAAEDRPTVNQKLKENGLSLAKAFQKDASLVRFDKLRIDFTSGLVLVGPTADVRNHVRIRTTSEPPGVEVNDTIASMNGR